MTFFLEADYTCIYQVWRMKDRNYKGTSSWILDRAAFQNHLGGTFNARSPNLQNPNVRGLSWEKYILEKL